MVSVVEQLVQILEKTVSTDQRELEEALQYLKQAAERNLPEFLRALSEVLHHEGNSRVARVAAGLQLKNHLVAKDPSTKKAYQERWMTFPEDTRAYIKNHILLSLGTEHTRPSSAAQCVACVAVIEIPANQWPSVITTLTQNVIGPNSAETLKEASLEAIGYICQDMEPDALMYRANEILTAIIQAMRSPGTIGVRFAATNALLNSLAFTSGNFEQEVERNYIMEVVCETAQSEDIQVREAALECLVEIMALHYQHMEPYMAQALFPITFEAMKSDVYELSLQGVEFWSTIAEEEIELQKEKEEAAAVGRSPTRTSKLYATAALQHLVPVVLSTLTKQDELDDEDAWNPSKAAGVCLALLSECCKGDIIQFVLPFIQQNMKSADWRYRDAALMAFGSILGDLQPTALQPVFYEAIPTVIESMHDTSVAVRDTAAWTISRICRIVPETVMNETHLKPILEALIHGLRSEPRVAVNVCWAFIGLAEACFKAADAASNYSDQPKTYLLSPYFEVIVEQVFEATTRSDGDKANLRPVAYEALMELIRRSPKDCFTTVQKATMVILERLDRVLEMEQQNQSHHDRAQFGVLQGLLCSTLQSSLSKITLEDALKISDPIMTALLQIFSTCSDKSGYVLEDAIMAVSALVEAIGEDFKKYMPAFKPYLCLGLNSRQDYEVCRAAIGLTGDIFQALRKEAAPYSDEIMTILLEIVADPNVHRSVKPEILSVFGDIALGTGSEFKRYLDPVLQTLLQASCAVVDTDDYELYAWVLELRKRVMGAYSCIIQGLECKDPKNTCSLALLQPHVPSIIQFMTTLALDGCKQATQIRAWAGLIVDLCSCGPNVASMLDTDPVRNHLSQGCRSTSQTTKRFSKWATEILQKSKLGALASGDADRMEFD